MYTSGSAHPADCAVAAVVSDVTIGVAKIYCLVVDKALTCNSYNIRHLVWLLMSTTCTWGGVPGWH